MQASTTGMTAQDVTALCAVSISILSLIVSIVSLQLQRRHDRKSVQPIPQIIVGDYEDNLLVAIENAGVGPLIINSVQVTNTLTNVTEDSVIAHMKDLPEGVFWSDFTEKIEGRAIPAQTRLTLLELTRPEAWSHTLTRSFEGLRNDVRTDLGYLRVTVTGSDIYGSKLPNCSRALDWFHRLLFHGPNRAAKAQ